MSVATIRHRERAADARGRRRGGGRAGQLPVAVRAAAGARLSVVCDRPGRRRPRRRARHGPQGNRVARVAVDTATTADVAPEGGTTVALRPAADVVVPSTRRVRGRIVAGTLLFIAGFTVIFTLVSVVAASVGRTLDPLRATPFEIVVGAFMIVLGLAFLGLVPGLQRECACTSCPPPDWPARRCSAPCSRCRWTPCIRPDARRGARAVGVGGQTGRAVTLAHRLLPRARAAVPGLRARLPAAARRLRGDPAQQPVGHPGRRRAADPGRPRAGHRRLGRLHQLAAGDRGHRLGEHLMTDVRQQHSTTHPPDGADWTVTQDRARSRRRPVVVPAPEPRCRSSGGRGAA